MLFYVNTGSKKSQPGSKSQPMASRRRCRSATLSRTAGKKGETLEVLGPINLVRRDVARAPTFLGGETRKYTEIKAASSCVKRKRSGPISARLHLAGGTLQEATTGWLQTLGEEKTYLLLTVGFCSGSR